MYQFRFVIYYDRNNGKSYSAETFPSRHVASMEGKKALAHIRKNSPDLRAYKFGTCKA